MMMKRALLALTLGAGVLGGAATAVHASTPRNTHPLAAHAWQQPNDAETADQAGDTDATAPCVTTASGDQTGACQDSQGGVADAKGAAGQADTGRDGDTAQVGDQTGSDVADGAGAPDTGGAASQPSTGAGQANR